MRHGVYYPTGDSPPVDRQRSRGRLSCKDIFDWILEKFNPGRNEGPSADFPGYSVLLNSHL